MTGGQPMKATTLTVLVIIVTAVWSSGCWLNSSRSLSAPADQTKAPDTSPGGKPSVPKNAITDAGADKSAPQPNLMVIGASSLLPPLGQQPQLLRAMLRSKGIQMHIEGRWPPLDALSRMKSSKRVWDYVIIDAWHFGRGRTDPPDFPKNVAAFVKQVRAQSPKCKIILFPWWLPDAKATNEDVMEVFRRCVGQARLNGIWVATTGPAFMEVRLARPDLRVTYSKTDAHPGVDGAYINACSVYALITGESPVGLPATLRITVDANGGKTVDFAIAPGNARYLQEAAWRVYQREIKNTKPVK
jgi:hypothetical protein